MEIFLNILFLLIGFVLLIKGADMFVSGASSLAKKIKVPAMFIGLTIVAIGTSLPELSVSVVSALQHSQDLSVGNIVGSNLFNMFMAFGLVAIITPIAVKPSNKKIDFPFLIIVTSCLLIFSADVILEGGTNNVIGRVECFVLLGLLASYMFFQIQDAKKERKKILRIQKRKRQEFVEQDDIKILPTWKTILFLVLGAGFIIFGAECVSKTAQFLALQIGMSEALVGLTIVAIGTSLPELVTSIMAAKKGENELALGNIVGSSIMNIVLIIGLVGAINPILISGTILTDIAILFGTTILFVVLGATKGKYVRWHGFVFVGIYLAYMAFAIVRNYCF